MQETPFTTFGPGECLSLSRAQFAARFGRVLRTGEPLPDGRVPVVVVDTVSFKPGDDVVPLPRPALPLADLVAVSVRDILQPEAGPAPSESRFYGGKKVEPFKIDAPATFERGSLLMLAPKRAGALVVAGALARVRSGPAWGGLAAYVVVRPVELGRGEAVIALAPGSIVEHGVVGGYARPTEPAGDATAGAVA